MKIDVFDFEVDHNGKIIPANCAIYTKKGETLMPYKYPVYRVVLMTKEINPPVYLLYRTDEPAETFFWYPVGNKHKGMMEESIAAALEKLDMNNVQILLKK